MFKARFACAALLGLSMMQAAQAGIITAAAGENYGFVSRVATGAGIGLTMDYVKATDNNAWGNQPALGGIGLTFGLPLPLVQVDVGAKAMWLDAQGSGTAGLVGGRVTVDLPMKTAVFAQSYWAPSGASSGSIHKVNDSMIGLRWQPMSLLGVEAGYRQTKIERNDSHRNGTPADGAYIGLSMDF